MQVEAVARDGFVDERGRGLGRAVALVGFEVSRAAVPAFIAAPVETGYLGYLSDGATISAVTAARTKAIWSAEGKPPEEKPLALVAAGRKTHLCFVRHDGDIDGAPQDETTHVVRIAKSGGSVEEMTTIFRGAEERAACRSTKGDPGSVKHLAVDGDSLYVLARCTRQSRIVSLAKTPNAPPRTLVASERASGDIDGHAEILGIVLDEHRLWFTVQVKAGGLSGLGMGRSPPSPATTSGWGTTSARRGAAATERPIAST